MSTVQDALKAREERRKKEQEKLQANNDKVTAALENRKSRMKSNAQSASSDLAKRINAEIETIKTLSTPSWGKDSLKNTLESTRNSRVSIDKLTREVESYKSYLDENTYNSFISTLNELKKSYDSHLSSAEVREMFDSEDAYTKWYESNKKRLEEQEAIFGADDYAEKSQYVSTKSDGFWDKLKSKYGMGFDDLAYEYINNVGGIRDEIKKKHTTWSSGSSSANNGESSYEAKGYDYLSDNEVRIYNYYYSTQGKDRAQEYLDSLEDTLVQRKANKEYEALEGNTIKEIMYGAYAGYDQFASGVKNLGAMVMGDEAITSSTHYVSGMVREDLADNGGEILGSSIGQIGYDLMSTTSNMLPSIIVGAATGGAGGTITLGASAIGNGYAEMRRLGYDENQARAYGFLVGASEAALQYALGGISKLGGKVSGNAVSKLLSKIDNAFARTAIKLGGNMASEGLEESIQTVLEPAFKALATGEDFEGAEWDEVLYSGLLGALSAEFLEGVPTIASTIASDANAKKMYGNGAELVTESLDIDPGNAFAQRMQTKLDKGKSLSGGQINRLVETNEQNLKAQDTAKMKSAVEARLTELGETGDIGKLADVIVKAQSGETLTRSERAILMESKYGRRVSTELNPKSIESGEYTSKWAENIGTERINERAYNKALYDLAVEQTGASVGEEKSSVTKNPTSKEIVSESKFKASENGKTMLGDTEVAIKEIASVKDGELTLRLEDGSTVNASDVEYGSDAEGLLYENVVDMGLNAATANAFLNGYDPSMNVQEYILGFREAYRYGEYGFPKSEMSTEGFSSHLSESQKSLAYDLGKTDAKYKTEEKQKAITEKSSATRSNTEQVHKGRVHYEGSTLAKGLTGRQKASLKGIETLANALGVDFHIFESEVGENGKRKGANGWFNPKDGSIHIDLYAGLNGEGTILFTASHELTHFIREWSPAKFKVFADFLLEQYGQKGISADELVQQQIEKAKRNGRDIDFDTAYEEVVADSCEAMLADGDVVAKIAELKAKDQTLWQKIKDFITDLVAKIKQAYDGLSPDSVEGRYVSEMLDAAEKLKELWTEALVEASDNYTSAEKTLFDNGIAVDSKTESASLLSVRDLLNSKQQHKVAETLATRFGVTVEEAKGWIGAETSLASIILNPKYSQYLDYTADENEEAIKSNSDYPQGTVDFSNICKKRRDFTEVMNRVLRNFPNHVFEATDLAKIRTIMSEEGMEVACGICYVEDRRQLDSIVAQNFIDSLALYRNGSKTKPDGTPFNANQLKAFDLIKGDPYTPSIYELISLEGRNSLKAKNPSMEAAWVKFNNARGMQSVRLLLNDAEYKRQILKYSPTVVKRKNDLGGLRIYSFSDMEMFHLIDIIQVITDSATVGLSLQGYTKVNEYARAVKETGEKLNRSLIPKGDLGYHIEDGKVVLDYDTVEGIDINHPDFFDNIDNPNVGNIVIGINATQIKAAMASKFIDQIIPFHTGQSNDVLGEKGIATWVNYKDFQSERDVNTQKKSSHQINIYTEVINAAEAEGHPITNKVEFVNKFLEVCKKNGLIPRFSDFLNVDENGDFVYTEGYHKFLVDFKTFDQNTGEYLPQMPVKPIFDNEYITQLLKDYVKSQKVKDAKFSKAMPKVLERITTEIVNPKNSDIRYSDRDSEGNALSKEQQEFFKDSKVRDADGNLIPVYHGTFENFTIFDINKTANANIFGKGHYFTSDKNDARDNYASADGADVEPKIESLAYFYFEEMGFTEDDMYDNEHIREWNEAYDKADEFYKSGKVLEVYLNITNPVYADKYTSLYDKSGNMITEVSVEALKAQGYDGIIDYRVSEKFDFQHLKEDTAHYIVFDSNQIKLTSNKAPTSNPDIRYSDRYQSADTNSDILSMVEKVESGNFKANDKVYLGTVGNSTATEIRNHTGINVDGFKVAIEARQIEHIIKDHGKNGTTDRSMANPSDIAKIEYALANYDDIRSAGKTQAYTHMVNGKNRTADTVLYETSIGEKSYYVVQAVPDTKAKTLYIVTAFIGKKGYKKEATQLINAKSLDATAKTGSVITSGNIISQSNDSVKREISDADKVFSDRSTDSVSNRSLLANALESVAQNDIEKRKLEEYKSKIALIEAEQKKLAELRAKIKELSFSKGERSIENREQISELNAEATITANRIHTYDRQLLNLESTKALKGVLEREKKTAYKRAEQRGREALKEQREKDRERSAKTQRELMKRYQESRTKGVESRKKTEMRYKIKTVVNDLYQYLEKGTKEKHVPISLQKPVAEALAAVNMDTVGAEERIAKKRAEMLKAKTPEAIETLAKEIEHIQEMGGNMEAKLARFKTAYDSIINSDDPLVANAHDEVISNTIDKVIEVVGETPLRDMSLYQLEAVYDMYRMVLTSVRNANKAFKMAKNEEISVLANRVIEDLVKQKRKTPYSKAALEKVSEFNWNNLKPVYAFERIGSSTFTEVFNNVRAGEDVWARDMSEAQAFREEQYKKYKYNSWDFKKRHGFTSTSGIRFELSLDQIMSLYAYSKRDQAGDHLKFGGFVFDGITEVKQKTKAGVEVTYRLKDATAYNLSEQTLADIISKLTPEQKAFVDEMQDYLSTTMGEKGNEVSLALYNVKLFKEKNYFPLKSAKQYLARAREQAQGDVKIKNSGFTNETTPNAKNPITLTPFMDVWAGHVNEMSMYHAFTLPLEDFYRVYNYSTPSAENYDTISVISSLENAHRDGAVAYIDQLLKDINGGARSDPRETLGKSMMSNFKKASVMASLSVAIQQPSAIIRAQALVDAKYFVGKRSTRGKHKEVWAEVKKYAPVAIIKEMGYFDTGMGRGSVDWLKGEKTLMDKVDDATSKLPALVDELTWCAIWNAVKRETLHTHKGLKPNSEEFLKAVGERFTEVIVKTQVYDSTLARSANMRSKSALMNMWTAFMAEPTTSINMLQDSFRKGKRGKYTLRALGAVYGSVILNSALVSIVYAMRDDDEDETYLEKYLSRFTTEVIDGVNPLTYIPFVKDIWSTLQGFDIERADMSLITAVTDSLQQLVKVIAKDTSDMDEEELAEHKKAITEAILSITDHLASLVGVPVKNVRRDLNGVINGFKTIKEDKNGRHTTAGSLSDNIGEDLKNSVPVWGWLTDEKKTDKLYDAIIKGDTAYVDRIKNSYDGEKAYHAALRKALRENDPRIKEAALADFNGDVETYSDIITEIVNEGKFDEADILSAVKSEINELEGTEESPYVDKDVSLYDVEHYYTALVKGNTSLANTAKEDIISTAVSNGKTREEAEKSFNDSFRNHLKKEYAEGNLSRSQANDMLIKHTDTDSDESYWLLKKWDYYKEHGTDDGYSKYTNFYDAVRTGKNLKSVISEYTSHGVTNTTLASQITSYYKPLYKNMSKNERANIKGYLLNAYALLGYDRTKKSKDIEKWLED